MTDPAADTLIRAQSGDEQRLAVSRPRAFDIQRVTIATTKTMLCASVTFAQRDRAFKPGQLARRLVVLEIAPPRVPRGSVILGRLMYGHGPNLTRWIPYGAIEDDNEEQLDGERISGEQGREVQLAVPVRKLHTIASRRGKRRNTLEVTNLDPRSFSWRISVASDCAPGRRELIVFPSGQRRPAPTPFSDCR